MRFMTLNAALRNGAAILALCASPALAQASAFNIPSEDAGLSIPELARQAGVQIVAPGASLHGVVTPAVKGAMDVRVALDQMLKHTDVAIASNDGQTIILAATPKNVQSASNDGAAAESSIETVNVSATRVDRQGYTAPTPVSVIGTEEIQQQAPENLADLINKNPALVGSLTPGTVNASVSSLLGQNLLNLRGLGSNRTLVLMDGQRLNPTTVTGNIDINTLPTALVKRVDIVTGGASADWGSDAVAGVVNLILDRKYNGFKAEIQAGETQYDDNQNLETSLTYGTPFAGDRGHFEISGQYRYDGPVGGAATSGRSWDKGYKVIGNPNGTATSVVLPNVGFASATPGGVIVAGPLAGTQFLGVSGTPAPFNLGYTSGLLSVNGSGYDFPGTVQLQGQQQGGTLFTRASYDLTPSITAYAEGSYAKALAVTLGTAYNRFGNLPISSGNPFIPASIQAQMTAGKIASFSLGTTNPELGFMPSHVATETFSFDFGLDGDLGDGWTWTARAQTGEYDLDYQVQNEAIVANYTNAVNAVTNPTTGQIVCASAAAQAAGCTPLNVFGSGTPLTSAQRSYILGTGIDNIETQQNDFSANIKGSPFSTWAGIVSVASGMEYRTEHYSSKTGPLDQSGALYLSNGLPASGSYNVIEGYVETVVPLLSNLPFVKELDFNGAIRETGYSQSGDVTTWKMGLTYSATSELSFRGVWSTDIRAPNLNDLFANGAPNTQGISDPVTKTSYLANTTTTGNTALNPEVAHTESAGAIYQPAWLPGLDMSIDYFNININNAILALSAQQVLNQCAAGVTQACGLITRGANSLVTSIQVSAVNLQQESTAGYDLSLSYRTALSDIISSLPGDLNLRALATNTIGHKICSLGTCIEYAGTNGDGGAADPQWRGLFSATYKLDEFTTTLTSRYIGGGIISNKTPTIVNNGVPAIAYFDLSGAYKFDSNFEAYAVVQNLLNQKPPVAPSVANPQTSNGTDDYIYDVLGRQFRIGLRVTY